MLCHCGFTRGEGSCWDCLREVARKEGACKKCGFVPCRCDDLQGECLPSCLSGWPQVSRAFAVHRKQIKQAMERNARNGVRVTYDSKGRAIIPDRKERARLCRLEGMHDNDGGFNDYTGYSGSSPNGRIIE